LIVSRCRPTHLMPGIPNFRALLFKEMSRNMHGLT
jgi:hypothetical protein